MSFVDVDLKEVAPRKQPDTRNAKFKELLIGRPFNFWACSNEDHNNVTWHESGTKTQAYCLNCGEKSPVFDK